MGMDNFIDEYHTLFGIHKDLIGYEYVTFAPTAIIGDEAYNDIKQNNRCYITIFDDIACEYLEWIFEKYFDASINEEPYFDTTGYNFYTRDKVFRIMQNIKRVRDWVKAKPPKEITRFTNYTYAYLKRMTNDDVVEFYDVFLELMERVLKDNYECKYFVVICG